MLTMVSNWPVAQSKLFELIKISSNGAPPFDYDGNRWLKTAMFFKRQEFFRLKKIYNFFFKL